VDRPRRPGSAVHVHRARAADPDREPGGHRAHPHRHLPLDQHPGHSNFERTLTTTVDNIQRIESTTTSGQAIIKVFLQPSARLDTANAQITAISQTVLRQYPPGTTPPLIINYSASSVPILQLALSGDGLAEQ
jgi:hypothetical protein